MAIVKPVLYPENALEAAILTLDPDGSVTDKDVERLTDRDIGLENEDQDVTGQRTWHADLGIGSLPAISAWLFDGAAYAGELITLQSSPDNAAWTTRATTTPAEDVPQLVTGLIGAPVTARYWRWYVTDPAAPIRFTEVWLSPVGISLTFKPSAPHLREPTIPNVNIVSSAGGRDWGVKKGSRRWRATYVMTYAPDSDRTLVYDLLDAIEDGVKPFWLLSLTGELRWCRMDGSIDFQNVDKSTGNWDIPLNFLEVLP